MDQEKGYFGYNFQFLRVNLTTGNISTYEPPRDYYQRYLGGRGFIVTTLLQEIPAKCDPLGPQNKLIFALGPLTGLPIPGARNSVGAKSPLTGAYGEAEVGGFWGPELKKAGFDAIIIEGIAETPVYLWIKDGNGELRDAGHLWGLEVAQTHVALQEEVGDPLVRTAIIGSGGEKLIRYACIMNDICHAAGRTGMGAVMGSKKLKAIAVRGNKVPPMANPEAVRDLARLMAKHFKERTQLWQVGTGRTAAMEAFNLAGILPLNNFQEGLCAEPAKISSTTICQQFGVGMHGCYACPIRCKKEVKIDSPRQVDPIYGGPEYETLAAFGYNCGVSDPAAVCKAHELCNRHGIDSISAGVTISFAMECFSRGILTLQDTGGIDLKFGNADAMLQMLMQILQRKGLGDLLAQGSKAAAMRIGKGSEEFAMQVKGMEIAMHDPRARQGLALHKSIHATGPDHASGIFEQGVLQVEELSSVDFCEEPVPISELSPRKARLLYHHGLWKQVINHLVSCLFCPFTNEELCEAVEAATGWRMSYWRLMKTAERGVTLLRIFNLREGFSEADDILPKRMEVPRKGGHLQVAVDPSALLEAQKLYYRMLGWDEHGVPTKARLVELDIDWAASMVTPSQ